MSRIGKLSIKIPEKVIIKVEKSHLTVYGPKGELSRSIPFFITIVQEGSVLKINSSNASEKLYGTYRSLIYNMIQGVTKGFEKKLELQGVGYRSQLDGKYLTLNVGYSHPVKILSPETIKLQVENSTVITVSGINKELVGQLSANIRLIRPPEPYKGKGIRYQGEYVRKKVGKAGKK
jgi:large subunit ribosomal protein L6|uniref:ribosomal protein L6 n=1 Tax=Cryptomonas gyropyrenoidosa TaxID=233257 RepID=UPI0027A0201A|nr:ribosomal protein L6 [Cryptomonas gyropyrenoidosa]WFQ83013.1 ribosomal protein L6 [Cryptomonas gyropyrenoidosa]